MYKLNPKAHYLVPITRNILTRQHPNDERPVECEIAELIGNYKVTLRAVPTTPIDYQRTVDYYIDDFESLVENGYITELTPGMNYRVRHTIWREPLCGKIYLVHETHYVEETPSSDY